MNYISVFSGLECAHLAWAPLGWTCKAVAEIEPAACLVLGKRLNASAPKYLPIHIPVMLTDDEGNETGEWSKDPFPRSKYKRLPPFGTPGTLPNFGDVSQVTEEDLEQLGAIDVLIGGSPCQDLSVAGKRAGLEKEDGSATRSGLFHQQLRIFHATRTLCGARFLVWENVPGAFSSNAGRDFALVVGEMAGCRLVVPRDGWGNEGMALGKNGLVEWSVLDAQWFNVAQRRARVFAVLDTGDWANRCPILLEPDGLRGDSAPSRQTGQNPTGTLSSRTTGGGGLGTDFDLAGGLVPEITGALIAGSGPKGYSGATVHGAQSGHVLAFGGNDTSGPIPAASALNANRGCHNPGDFEAGTLLVQETAHTLRADGFDASEDGTGRGTPLVPVHVGEVSSTLTSGPSSPASHGKRSGTNDETLIAFSCKDHGAYADAEVSPTLRSMNNADSNHNGGGQIAVAFQTRIARNGRGYGEDVVPALSAQAGRTGKGDSAPCVAFTTEQTPKTSEEVALTLTKQSPTGGGQPQCVAFAQNQRDEVREMEVSGAIASEPGMKQQTFVAYTSDGEVADPISASQAKTYTNEGVTFRLTNCVQQPTTTMAVRRLTPRECERLQGIPDDYTMVPVGKDKMMADGPRYKMLGNSFARPCIEWIGKQIMKAVACGA